MCSHGSHATRRTQTIMSDFARENQAQHVEPHSWKRTSGLVERYLTERAARRMSPTAAGLASGRSTQLSVLLCALPQCSYLLAPASAWDWIQWPHKLQPSPPRANVSGTSGASPSCRLEKRARRQDCCHPSQDHSAPSPSSDNRSLPHQDQSEGFHFLPWEHRCHLHSGDVNHVNPNALLFSPSQQNLACPSPPSLGPGSPMKLNPWWRSSCSLVISMGKPSETEAMTPFCWGSHGHSQSQG